MSNKPLPILYKKTSTGAIQTWKIEVRAGASETYEILTSYGQLDGKIQETVDVVKKGKNAGRSNETSPEEQARAEAFAKWEKQKKRGYVESLDSAQKGEVDELIEGGIVPMLAQSYAKHAAKIKFPAFAQPKLDGIRCIAILTEGKCTLWTRTRKPITGVPHIVKELERLFGSEDLILDGELYNHDLKKDFEKIVSFVRQDVPQPGHEVVQYHVYDVAHAKDKSFEARWEIVKTALKGSQLSSHVFAVSTERVESADQVAEAFSEALADGYEGLMLRNAASFYANKRSYDLQKVKEFEDSEFEIVGIEEGRGRLIGHVGSFVCKTKDGKEFLAKMSGDTAMLKRYFEDHKLWKNKVLTVKYQGLTGTNNVPRFPVGVAIRDYE